MVISSRRETSVIRHSLKVVAEIFATILAGSAILVALFGWRLSSGPISIEFLTPYIQEALNDNPSGVRVSIGATDLRWTGFDSGLDIVAHRVRAFGEQGAPLASVPELGISLDGPSLMRGRIAPTRLDFVRPRLDVVRRSDGTMAFDVGGEDQGAAADDTDLLARLFATLERPGGGADRFGRLEELSVTDARLRVDDQRFGLSWQARRADIRLVRNDGRLAGGGRIILDLGDRSAEIRAAIGDDPNGSGTLVDASFDRLRPSDLALRFDALKVLAAVELPLSGTVRFRLDEDFAPTAIDVDATGGAGRLAVPTLQIDPVDIAFAQLRGRLNPADGVATVQELFLDLGGPTLTAAATIVEDSGHLRLFADAEVRDLPVDDLARYWPAGSIRGARKWVTGNLSAGMIDSASVTVSASAPGDPRDGLEIQRVESEIRFRDVRVDYLNPLPPILGARGRAHFDGRIFGIDVEGGSLLDMRVTPSRIVITGLESREETIAIETGVIGSLGTILTVLDSPRLGYASELGLDPKRVRGDAAVTLELGFPLIAGLRFDDVGITARATMTSVSLENAVAGLTASDGALTLGLDRTGMTIDGSARLEGIPTAISWRENFGTGAEFRSRVTAEGIMGDDDRRRLGIDADRYLRGPIGFRAVRTLARGGTGSVEADLDLSGAAIAIPQVGWEKPSGTEGRGRFSLTLADGRPSGIDAFVIETVGLAVRGSAAFKAEDTVPTTITIESLVAGRTDMSADVVREGEGYRIAVTGRRLDIRGYASNRPDGVGAEPRPGDGPPLALSVRLDELVMADGEAFADVDADFHRAGGGILAARVDARTMGGAKLSARFRRDGASPPLWIETDDAGSVLRGLGLFGNLSGGRLLITGREDRSGPTDVLVGDIELRDYRLLDAPVLARLLNAASPRGFNELMSEDGINFERLVGKYRWEDGVLILSDARTAGSALGLTLNGRIDLRRERMNLEGTIVPVYGINRVIGAIPLVGDLLTGGEGQGLFAATYTIRGSTDDPTVLVNPLAALAPGFLRNLFFLEGESPLAEDPRRQEYPNDD